MQKYYYKQEEIDFLIESLSKKLRIEEFDEIIGIERGGVYVAKKLSQLLGINYKTIKVSFYTDTVKNEIPQVNLNDVVFTKEKKYLFVDDLIDSGSTFRFIQNSLMKKDFTYKSAVIFHNKENKSGFVPDYYSSIKPDFWIVFPWEEELVKIISI
jgi:hypoxanthine phosphoribosyltransferase